MSDPLPNTFDERWQESQRLREPARSFMVDYSFEILVLAALIGLGLLLFADRMGYTTNVYTELLSVAVTILVLVQVRS